MKLSNLIHLLRRYRADTKLSFPYTFPFKFWRRGPG